MIEKDAIFRSLCSSQFWRTAFSGPGAIVTAKGYPDLITRSFLSFVQSNNPQLPILGLMDFDPDGISILKCYRHGSQRLAHEADAFVQAMRWIGIKSSQLILIREREFMVESWEASSGLPVNQVSNTTPATTKTSVASTSCQDPVTYLSQRDRKTAVAALRSAFEGTDDMEIMELHKELQVMLFLGTKAEIEWLDESGNLCQWLDYEIGLYLS